MALVPGQDPGIFFIFILMLMFPCKASSIICQVLFFPYSQLFGFLACIEWLVWISQFQSILIF